MGYTAEWAGLVLSPGGLITLCLMPIVGRLVTKVEPRWLVVTGLVVLATGMYKLSTLSMQTGFWTFVFIWAISRGGLAFFFVPVNVTAFSHVSRERTSSATGLINLTRNMGGSIGISTVTTLQTRLAQAHQNVLSGHMTALDPAYTARVGHLQTMLQAGGSSAALAGQQANGIVYGEMLRQSAMLAYLDVFRMLCWLCVAMIPAMLFLKRGKSAPGAGASAH
jgi:DHA2 family multidrug resistance protein